MGIVLSSAFALAQAGAANADHPIIGWHNLATTATLTTTHAGANDPASNLANPATNLLWKADSLSDGYITVLFGAEESVDYFAIARHNLGSGLCPITIQGLPAGGDPNTPGDWDELVAVQQLADDTPVIFRFASTPLIGIRAFLEPAATAPHAAVVYTGALLVMERGVQPGATPLSRARERNIASPRSQSGEFLGSVINGEALRSSAAFKALSPAWYRSTFDPFLAATAGRPFFWGWKPGTYPTEVAYAWMPSDPKPTPDMSGNVDVTLQLEGLAL